MKEQGRRPEEAPVHDGVSPIAVTEGEPDAQFHQLWKYLVPPSGRARTAQGEIIRIAGRVNHEIWDNGCINWDDDYRKMLRAFPQYLHLGNPFSPEDIRAAEILVGLLQDGRDVWDDGYRNGKLCAALCACAVAWVQQNPEVIAPLEADYTR